ncbi:ATP-binding protein [Limisalsivibrio acetivorans]|uniref:ATP-binding protein n=1 Tax=Limisalsivibrio acetivorans TaxID=1304888 RepID=UPI0003B66DD7|nr:sensor histidine kinase [Limisalsivibrio acetivorans]
MLKRIIGFIKPKTLQNKLILIISGLVVLQMIALGTMSLQIIAEILENQIGKRALSVSKTVSEIPSIRKEIMHGDPEGRIQGIVEGIRIKTGAEFIVVGNHEGRRFAHPDEYKIGRFMVGGDSKRALQRGESYVSKAVGTLGPSIRGKVPVFDDNGNVIGIVSTGYLIKEVEEIIGNYQMSLKYLIAMMALIGVAAAVYISRGFKKAIFGLEPREIANLLEEKNAILESIREGVAAVNEEGRVTMLNTAALSILNLPNADDILGRRIGESEPERLMTQVLKTGNPKQDQDLKIGEIAVVMNIYPIKHNADVIGAVASFRRKDEISRMAKELSRVKQYSEMLRAQTHEFSNKLHTLAGLIQIEAYTEALDMIITESTGYYDFFKLMSSTVKDPMLSAIIIGKYSYAQENNIEVTISGESSMKDIPEHIDRERLVTILGNLFDNAFDAVREECAVEKKVHLLMMDYGKELIFEIEDSGCGIDPGMEMRIFEKGVTTKDEQGRGYGLHLVRRILEEMGGYITVSESKLGGALFTVALPKEGQDG